MTTRLTAIQREAVDRMRAEGATRLVRWSGGFWTTPGDCGQARFPYIPQWSVGVQTVRAMEKKGVLRRANTGDPEWRDPRELVPEEQWP